MEEGGHLEMSFLNYIKKGNIYVCGRGGLDYLEMSCLCLPIFDLQYELLYSIEQPFLLVTICMHLTGWIRLIECYTTVIRQGYFNTWFCFFHCTLEVVVVYTRIQL